MKLPELPSKFYWPAVIALFALYLAAKKLLGADAGDVAEKISFALGVLLQQKKPEVSPE